MLYNCTVLHTYSFVKTRRYLKATTSFNPSPSHPWYASRLLSARFPLLAPIHTNILLDLGEEGLAVVFVSSHIGICLCIVMSCVIAANPDAAGIGVRTAVYVQAFVPTISLLINSLSGRIFNAAAPAEVMNTARSTIPPLLTGMALIISAIIQQHAYSLSVFDAVIVLNLCWITVVTGLAPLASPTINESPVSTRSSQSSRPTLSLPNYPDGVSTIMGLVILKLWLMAGFGLWLFTNINTFDRSPDACTSSTVVWVLGHHPHVTSSRFRHLMLALYSIALVPLLNLFIIVLALMPFMFFFITLLSPYQRYQNAHYNASIWKIFSSVLMLSYNALNAILIVLTEMMIRSNNVSSDESEWGLGQTSALMIALFSVTSIISQLWNIFRGGKKKRDGSEDAESVADVGDDLEHGSYSRGASPQGPQAGKGMGRVPSEKGYGESPPRGVLNPPPKLRRSRSSSL